MKIKKTKKQYEVTKVIKMEGFPDLCRSWIFDDKKSAKEFKKYDLETNPSLRKRGYTMYIRGKYEVLAHRFSDGGPVEHYSVFFKPKYLHSPPDYMVACPIQSKEDAERLCNNLNKALESAKPKLETEDQ